MRARYYPWGIAGGMLALAVPGTPLWAAPVLGAVIHMVYDADPEGWQSSGQRLLSGAQSLPERARQGRAVFERVTAALPVKAAVTRAHAKTRPAGAPRDPLLVTLDEHPHRLIIGHTRGGKTTLMHAMATGWAEQGARVLVCDPDASPGQWPGCRVVGGGDNFTAMGEGLRLVEREVGKRRTLRAEGQRTFAPVHIVVDEAQDVVAELPEAWPIMEAVARRGAKLNMHLTVGVQDKQVKTLGLQGKSELLRNFVVADIYKDREGRRMASMKDPAGVKVAMPIPRLTDPETLIKRRTGTVARVEPEAMLAQMLGVTKASESQGNTLGVPVTVPIGNGNGNGNTPVPNASVTVTESGGVVNVYAQAAVTAPPVQPSATPLPPVNTRARPRRAGVDIRRRRRETIQQTYARLYASGVKSFRKAYAQAGGNRDEALAAWQSVAGRKEV